MCWVCRTKEEKIAEKDIPVKKILLRKSNGTLIAPYQTGYKYKKGELQPKVELEPTVTTINIANSETILYYRIDAGYHSYMKAREKNGKVEVLLGGEPIYYYRTPYMKETDTEYVVADAIIPKGTKYFLNIQGEYVSETIKIL